jgi:threonine dehydrogenase-like Zn-dependent dehydrogenase
LRPEQARAAATRPGRPIGFVGVNYEVSIPGIGLFFVKIYTLGGPVPVRRLLIQLIRDRKIDPGKVFDLPLPLERASDGYKR